MQIVAATEKSRTLIYDADLGKPTVIVMGSEDKGISKEVLKLCDVQLAVPIIGSIESLNVSAAAAVLLLKRCASGFTDLGGGTVRNSAACGESQQPVGVRGRSAEFVVVGNRMGRRTEQKRRGRNEGAEVPAVPLPNGYKRW